MKEHYEQVQKKNGKKRAIIVKFLNYKDKDAILKQYRQKQLWKDNIYVNEGYSESTADLRKQLFEQAKEIPQSGKSAKVLCIRNLRYQGSATQHKFKFSLIEFQSLFFFCIKN